MNQNIRLLKIPALRSMAACLLALTVQSAAAQSVGNISIFQYAIFYNLNLEMGPGQSQTVSGPVFCNANIWEGNTNLTFYSTVQAVGTNNTSALDPFAENYPGSSGFSTAAYSGTPLTNFALGAPGNNNQPLTIPLPTGTNAEAILNLPPTSFGAPNLAAYAASNQVYLFNASDLIISNASFGTNGIAFRSGLGTNVNILATNITIWFQDQFQFISPLKRLTNDFVSLKLTSGTFLDSAGRNGPNSTNHASTNILYAGFSFVTNVLFHDYREAKTNQTVQIDIAKFNKWLTNHADEGPRWNQTLLNDFGHGIGSIYVYNNSALFNTNQLPAVRLVNGSMLPTNYPGLTVATPQPLYVLGNYNVQTNGGVPVLGMNNTASTYPAALMADAITILSTNWNDSVTTKLPNSGSTTVNAALLTGIVPTVQTINGDYSGGVENFMRLLEDWTKDPSGAGNRQTLTYNGSIVAMFPSIYATNHWQPTGNYYNGPTRHWAFDLNFISTSGLPPLSPLPMNLNPPEITAQPQSQNIGWGSNVTFTVTAIGNSPMSYQWNCNATNISGATNVSLTLTNVQPSQAGAYSVSVTNAYGNLTSSNAVLSVFQTTAQFTFAPAVTNGIGHNPESFTVADVNGDGKIDLICGNAGDSPYNDGTLSILTNNGSGVFTLASSPGIGHGPGSIAAADVNGDGNVDLIMVNWDNENGSTLSIWTNNGSGIFGSNATYNVGIAPSFVVAVDVNGDSKLDLICANYGLSGNGNTLSVLTNNGSGVFSSNATLNVGNGPISVASADVNGDGKLDLICANSGDNTLTVLTNNGSGIFGSNSTYNVGNKPHSVVAADVTGDGKLDLICANENNDTLTVLTNNGNSVFGSNATYVVGNSPVCVTAADVNGDGKLDLITANLHGGDTGYGNLSVLTNNGSGGFVLAATLGAGNPSSFMDDPQSVMAADFNGDGKLDLTCENIGANTVAVLLNTTIFPAATSTPPLNINFQDNEMSTSWPSVSPGWSLQQNSDLTTTHWGPSGYSGYTISDDGTNKSLVMPPPPGNLFFRLLHP